MMIKAWLSLSWKLSIWYFPIVGRRRRSKREAIDGQFLISIF